MSSQSFWKIQGVCLLKSPSVCGCHHYFVVSSDVVTYLRLEKYLDAFIFEKIKKLQYYSHLHTICGNIFSTQDIKKSYTCWMTWTTVNLLHYDFLHSAYFISNAKRTTVHLWEGYHYGCHFNEISGNYKKSVLYESQYW